MRYTRKQIRQIALGAVRSEIRGRDEEIEDCNLNDAWKILDNIAREEPELIASQFYKTANVKEQRLFGKEWIAYIQRLKDERMQDEDDRCDEL